MVQLEKKEFNKNFLFVKMVGVETPLLFLGRDDDSRKRIIKTTFIARRFRDLESPATALFT
jgi:hypothetical protein